MSLSSVWEERERLETLIRGGKHPARKLTRARILLKADAGEAGEGWSDSQIAGALAFTNRGLAQCFDIYYHYALSP
jgi:hypothetical protein